MRGRVAPITVALVDDYDVVRGRRGPHARPATGTASSSPSSTPTSRVEDDVDIVLYDSFAQPESDHDEIDASWSRTRGPAGSSSTPGTSTPTWSRARAGTGCTATCPRRCRRARARRRAGGRARRRGRGQRAAGPGAQRARLDWPGRGEGLTDREAEILALITQGKSNAEVAALTYLSPNTVKSYIRTHLPQDRRGQPHPGGALGRPARLHARPPPDRALARRPLTDLP